MREKRKRGGPAKKPGGASKKKSAKRSKQAKASAPMNSDHRGPGSDHAKYHTKPMTSANIDLLEESLPKKEGRRGAHNHVMAVERDSLNGKITDMVSNDIFKEAAPGRRSFEDMQRPHVKHYIVGKMMRDEKYHGGVDTDGCVTCWHCETKLFMSGKYGYTVHNLFGDVLKHSIGICVLVHEGCNDELGQSNPPTACPVTGTMLSDGSR
jgi:hypothetical protein